MHRYTAPLLGLFIFSLASGYLTTLIPLRLVNAGHFTFMPGAIGAIYYLGLLIGSFRADRFVCRIGHIRAFAAFIALLSASVLGMGFSNQWIYWLLLRFISGLSVAGIFVVMESWLLSGSSTGDRGRVLAWYMLSLYSANALGQLLVSFIDSYSLLPFMVVGFLLCLSIFPPATTRLANPSIENPSILNIFELLKLTPSGLAGCFAGGLIIGALYSLLPVYLTHIFKDDSKIGYLLMVTMLGGTLLQYPVGHISDFIDRRKVLVGICIFGAIACTLFLVTPNSLWIKMPLLFVIGGTLFTLYPLSVSHACDHLAPEGIISGTQALLLAYSLGACIGPLFATFFDHTLQLTIMYYFIAVLVPCGVFFYTRIAYRPEIYHSEDQNFIPIPRTTPVVTHLDPRAEVAEDTPNEETESTIPPNSSNPAT